MIGHAPLRVIIGSNTVRAIARTHEVSSLFRLLSRQLLLTCRGKFGL